MRPDRLRIFGLGIAVFILGLFFAYRISQFEPQSSVKFLTKSSFMITVTEQPKTSGNFQRIDAANLEIYADLYPRYRVGDILKVSGEVRDNKIFRSKIEKIGQRRDFGGYLDHLRLKISNNIAALMPAREAVLVQGTVLGIDNIGRQFRDQLIATGTIHVVVVSGQNLMIVSGLFLSLSRYLGRRMSLGLSVVVVLGYAALTGFETPVVRATLMVLASSVAIFTGREIWPIWSLGISALVILLVWPQALFEVSFQLTFAATLGIMTLGKWLIRKLKKIPVIGENFAIACSAYLFTLPIIWWHFERISLIGPIVNTLVAPSVTPIMILGFLIAATSLLFMPFAQLLAYLAYVPAYYFVRVVDITSRIALNLNFN